MERMRETGQVARGNSGCKNLNFYTGCRYRVTRTPPIPDAGSSWFRVQCEIPPSRETFVEEEKKIDLNNFIRKKVFCPRSDRQANRHEAAIVVVGSPRGYRFSRLISFPIQYDKTCMNSHFLLFFKPFLSSLSLRLSIQRIVPQNDRNR